MSGSQDLIRRRKFFEKASSAGIAISFAPLALRGAGEVPQDRLAYDVSRFAVTDPKLVGYREAKRFSKVASRARKLWTDSGEGFLVACEAGAVLLDADGKTLREFRARSSGRCVARDNKERIYVGIKEGIQVFNPDGQEAGFWPAPDPRSWITAMDVDGADVFAADSGKRVVLRYDSAGKVVGRIGEKNKERHVPGIVLPSPYLDVKVAPDGLLRVNNTGRHCVEVYTREGDLEASWGKPTAAIQGFCGCCNPIALDVLPDGRHLTCEKGLPRVKIYSSEGEFQTVVAGPETFPENSRHGAARDGVDGTMGGLDAAVWKDGRILILDLVTANVLVMEPKQA
jgi:hypothetical protein